MQWVAVLLVKQHHHGDRGVVYVQFIWILYTQEHEKYEIVCRSDKAGNWILGGIFIEEDCTQTSVYSNQTDSCVGKHVDAFFL